MACVQRKKSAKKKGIKTHPKGVKLKISRTAVQTFEVEFSFDELKQLEEIEDVFGYSPQEIIARSIEQSFKHATESICNLMHDIRRSGAVDIGN
jgi:hypothetical protein